MLTAAMAQEEIQQGLCAVCAWCERYWEAHARAAGSAHACGMPCGGPAAGLAFPHYRGPRPNKASYCFICGAAAAMSVEFHRPGSGGLVGCCATHERLLRMILANKPGAPVRVGERLVPVVGAAEG